MVILTRELMTWWDQNLINADSRKSGRREVRDSGYRQTTLSRTFAKRGRKETDE